MLSCKRLRVILSHSIAALLFVKAL